MKNTLLKTVAAVLLIPALTATLVTPAQAAPTVSVAAGRTTVELSPGFLAAATSLGVTIGRVSPGFVSTSRGKTFASFPIIDSSLDLGTLKAEILHKGGLRISAGTTVVELTSYAIDTTGTPVLTGLVTLNDSVVTRAPLFDLHLPAIQTPLHIPRRGRVEIPNVALTLTKEAADLLNSVFRVTAFAEGLEIGTARVRGIAF